MSRNENLENVRRTLERGLKHAQSKGDDIYIDLFQHAIDELERAKQ